MAVTATHDRRDIRFDHRFFPGMAVVILVSVFVGFAKSYYLAGVFNAPPLASALVHVHGATFTAWIVLLMVQTSLVAAGRVDVHRRLGLLGFGLAVLMVVLGLWVATDSQVRHFDPGAKGADVRAFYTVTVSVMLVFATLIVFAFRNRSRPAAHKRLILIATIALLDAAFQRRPVPVTWWGAAAASFLCTIPLLLLIVGYD